MNLNFTIRAGGEYAGADNKLGRFSFDAATKKIGFKGGALDGALPAGFYAMFYEPQGRPTVSFRSESGSEAAFCQKR